MLKHKLLSLILCMLLFSSLFGAWQKLEFPSNEMLHHVRFADENTGWVLGEDYLYKTEDGGQTWSQQKESLGIGKLYVIDYSTLLMTNFDYRKDVKTNGIWRSTDGGATWCKVCDDEVFITEFDFINDNTGYAGGSDADYNALIKKTTDGGQSWSTVCGDFPESEYELQGISFISELEGWAVTYNGRVYKTTDGGETWDFQINFSKDSSEAVRDIEFVNTEKGMVIGGIAGCGKIWTTEDGGETWTYHDDLDNANGSSMDELQFLDENTCWMVGYGMYSNHSISHSDDFGNTWVGEAENIDDLEPGNQDGFTSFSMVNEKLGFFVSNKRPNYEGAVYKYYKSGDKSAINQNEEIEANRFMLHQNCPNPFNPSTTIRFELPSAAFVTLAIYDMNGKLLETLVQGEKNAGLHTTTWSAGNFSTGIYFYKLSAGNTEIVNKCLYVK